MFKNKNDGNIVYKCTIRLLDDADILECEFQVKFINIFNSINEVINKFNNNLIKSFHSSILIN